MEPMDGRENHHESNETRDLLLAFGGLGLMALGAGLVMSHPIVKRYLGQMGVNDIVQGALPDIERYLRLRSM